MPRPDAHLFPSSRQAAPMWLRCLALLLWACLLFALAPTLAVGGYLHPFGDDYAFGVPLYYALRHGQSIPAALLNTVRVYWHGWQGTFSGVLAMELMPGAFHVPAYALTPFVMIGILALASGKLLHTLVCRWLGGSRWHWLSLWAGILLLWTQCLPDPAQSFYWWNGAALYTLFFALMVLLAERMAALLFPAPAGRRRRILLQAAVLALLVSGGNYVTGLLAGLLIGLFWLGALIWRRRRWLAFTLILAVYAAGFAVNCVAPGNLVRQSEGQPMAALQAIEASLTQGWTDLAALSSPLVWAVLLLLAPVLWALVRHSRFSFPCPGGMAVLAFLLFSAQNAPHFYTMSTLGPGRIRDITFFFYILALLGVELCLLGWLSRRLPRLSAAVPALWAGAAAALALTCGINTAPSLTAGRAAAALSDGSLAAYHELMLERETMYQDPALSQVYYAPAMHTQPELIYVYTVDSPDPDNFVNLCARNFFEKDLVACLSE